MMSSAHARRGGEFRASLPEGAWEEYYSRISDSDRETLDGYVEFLRESEPGLTDGTIKERYRILSLAERFPVDDDPFKRLEAPYIQEYDWPTWPAQDMMNWVPKEIRQKYGQTGITMLSGDFLCLNPQDASAIIAAFEAAGYTCHYDENLVNRASGM